MVRILSLNVRGLANEKKRRILFKYARDHADIVLFQETHSGEATQKQWQAEWGGKIHFSHGSSDARGVCTMFSRSFSSKIIHTKHDTEGRILVSVIKCDDFTFCLVNIYAPNKDTPQFFEQIPSYISDHSENNLIMGDLNLVLDPQLDRLGTTTNNDKSKLILENIINEFILEDLWHSRNPSARIYSWFVNRKGDALRASRLDHAIGSQGLNHKIENVTYLLGVMTDHSALFLSLKTEINSRGPGYWKFNNSHLANEEFVKFMDSELEKDLNTTAHLNPATRWEYLKMKVKKHAQKWSKLSKKENSLIISQLMEKIYDLECQMPLSKENTVIWENSRHDLEDLLQVEIHGIMFRSKAKWYEEGEKPTRYFLNLERARYNSKTCQSILKSGQTITKDSAILAEQKTFYQKLYTEDPDIKFSMQNDTEIKINPLEHSQLDQPVTQELTRAVKQLKPNKTPGNDGITADFYKIFWDKLGPCLTDAIQESFQQGQLFDSALQGILNVIPKPGKDSRIIANLRPITLLNKDYKLMEKVMANRILPHLETLINRDQKGFMANRRISANIRKMLDIMHIMDQEEDEQAFILNLDFRKAFNEVSHTAVIGSLKFLNFPDYIIRWAEILYTGFKLRIQNNGKFSDWIIPQRGLHQGECCSTTYFILCAETMAICLRGNEEIQGIPIGSILALLDQFADNMDVFSEYQ